ncbi:MAG: DUF1579 family protein [Gammaproteobacteria bacterium]
MNRADNRMSNFLALLLAGVLSIAALAPIAQAQDAALAKPAENVTPLLQEMVGTWDVQQRMWPGPDAQAINLPSAVAHRRLVGGAYLQEIMKPAHQSKQHAFTRTAYINFNPVSQRYEYFSIDTRAPQQMHYRSAQRTTSGKKPVELRGDVFVAPQWGEFKNVAFSYRLVLEEVKDNEQLVRLYLTPQSRKNRQEFLAFEYVYTRHH